MCGFVVLCCLKYTSVCWARNNQTTMMARVHPIISTARAVSRLQIVLESVFSPFGIATLPIVSSRRDEQGLLVTIAGLAFALNLSSLLAGMALLAADREHPPPACAARCAGWT